MKKKCEVCGKEFEATRKSDILCSEKCRQIHRRIRQGKYYNEIVRKQKELLIKTCPICGKTFETYNKQVIGCSPKCREEYFKVKNRERAKAAWQQKRNSNKKYCVVCGTEIPLGTRRKLCSEQCEKIWAKSYRKRVQYKEQGAVYTTASEEPQVYTCLNCGKDFVPHWCNQKYCSSECGKEYRKALAHKQGLSEDEILAQKRERAAKREKAFNAKLKAVRESGLSYGQYQALKYMEQHPEIGRVRI